MKTYRLGDLIEPLELKNENGKLKAEDVRGISVLKEIIPTKADLTDVKLTNYKILPKYCFTYSLVTSRNGNRISIAFNEKENCLISPINPVFSVKDTNILDPYYLMMFFKRKEFDRYARFNSWGSARETFDWNEMCSIKITLPSIDIQKKYVNVYKAMQRNLAVYQAKVDDLKLVCDGFIEKLRREMPSEEIGAYIKECDERNIDGKITLAQGVGLGKEFITPKQVAENKKNARIVRTDQFAYNRATTRNGDKISIAYRDGPDCVVSSAYGVFEIIKKDKLLPEYMMLWFKRSEFDRYARYYSKGSAHEFFEFSDMCEVKFPIPNMEIQKAIIQIYNSYRKRKTIADKMRAQINSMCPILIRGSIKEGE